MTCVVYANLDNGCATNLISGPDLGGFPLPTEGQVALLVADHTELPGWVDAGIYHPRPTQPGPGFEWSWESRQWHESGAALEQHRLQARQSVDRIAGHARLRYITSAPGQAETYTRKESQAREWQAAGFAGAAPSFIAAEAAALGVGEQALAQEVIRLADYWANQKGPQIESARIKWKAAIRAAQTTQDIDQAMVQAKQELDAL